MEHCRNSNFELLVDLFNSINVSAFSDVNYNFKKLKNKDIGHYIFHGVHKFEIPQHVKYFRCIKDFSLKEKMGFAGLCRSIITLYGKYFKLIDLINDKEIPQYIINQKSNEFNYLLHFVEKDQRDFAKNDILKLSLFLSSPISWKDMVSLIRLHYSEGLYQEFTFTESVFFLYLKPKEPNFIMKHSQNYKEDVSFYADCLAAAIQSFMLKLSNINIYQTDIRNYESMTQRIFLRFLDFFEAQEKLDDNLNYFKQLRFQGCLFDLYQFSKDDFITCKKEHSEIKDNSTQNIKSNDQKCSEI